MRYIKWLLTLLIVTITTQASSQRFSHSIGLDIVFPGKGLETSRHFMPGFWIEQNTTKITRAGVTYFPRYALFGKRPLSFSIGAPITLGVGFPVSSGSTFQGFSSMISLATTKKTTPRVAAEIPVVADINIGAGASPNSKDKTGIFIGGGYVYNHTSFYLERGLYKTDGIQPYFHGGVRFANKKILSLNVTYRPETSRSFEEGFEVKPATWGMQLLRDL